MRVHSPALAIHGGDVAEIAQRYGVDADSLLDFSANVNPLGPPWSVLQAIESSTCAQALTRYPDPRANVLRAALRERFALEPERIVIGNGAAALIDATLRALAPGPCLCTTPAFSEYARAAAAAGLPFEALPLSAADGFALSDEALYAALERRRPRVVILTNPHNPSGGLLERERLLDVLRVVGEAGAALLLDEAFIDYVPEHSLVEQAGAFEHLVVIRSLTKFYAMPALRVGYAASSAALAARIATFLPSWPVSTPAIEAGAAALADRAFEERSIAYNVHARERLAQALRALGLRVFPSAANFLLLELPQAIGSAGALRERMIRTFGVVVRGCSDYLGLETDRYLRVAVRDDAGNRQLVEALRGSL